jgi:hypothetical protein
MSLSSSSSKTLEVFPSVSTSHFRLLLHTTIFPVVEFVYAVFQKNYQRSCWLMIRRQLVLSSVKNVSHYETAYSLVISHHTQEIKAGKQG